MAAEHPVRVSCERDGAGWRCEVVVGDDAGATRHVVAVPASTLDRLAPDGSAEALVEASFRFLLEREPRASILGSFELEEIGRYFPDYPDVIRGRTP